MFDVSIFYDYFVLLGLLVVYINVFCAIGALFSSERVNSALVTLFSIAFFNLLMTYAQSKMIPMFDTNLELVQHLWYVVFAVCWLLSASVIYKLHSLLGIELRKFAKTVVIVSLCVGAFTLVKYICRMHLGIDSGLLDAIYSGLVNAVNVTIAILSVGITAMSLWLKFTYSKRIC